MTAREFLHKSKRLDETIKELMRERAEVREMAASISATKYNEERVQTSRSGDAPFVKHLERLDAIERRLDDAITERLEYKLALVAAFEKMSDAAEVAVLRFRYIDGMTWDEIAARLDKSVRTLHRLYDSAIAHFPVPENAER